MYNWLVHFSLFTYFVCFLSNQFVLSHKWLVAAGEESREKENQKLREMRVLEAVYPRPSAIPPRYNITTTNNSSCYFHSLFVANLDFHLLVALLFP